MVFNFTPVPRFGYRIGVPAAGFYRELMNSDAAIYGGSDLGNSGGRRERARSGARVLPFAEVSQILLLGCLLLKVGLLGTPCRSVRREPRPGRARHRSRL